MLATKYIPGVMVQFLLLLLAIFNARTYAMSSSEKVHLRDKVLEMFDHAFNNYMQHAYPADELMPISCKGRYRTAYRSRGDIDEVLGNYSLTLVDTLDTLALLNKVDEFESAVKKVIADVHFDRDIVISVFESNIRMLGGLLGGHVSLLYLRQKRHPHRFAWYRNELLDKAKDLADRLLPAFSTVSGLPMSRVNLKYGLTNEILHNEKDRFTCTACAGTLLLEFATLSRLSGDSVYEMRARQALQVLWDNRNRNSEMVGTVINVQNGEWAVKDTGIGAGIDSYYEYLFKGYMLLGDDELLKRFNMHYESLVKYNTLNDIDGMNIGHGGFMKTVSMHQPGRQSKSYIDSLLAFWPGLQVLKGDIKAAITMHETLNQIVKRYDFLPEAVLFDHSAHWAGHPLRPEFLESTYYLYKATNDHYYLDIAKRALNHLETYSRTECGFAAISDVRTKNKEDRMDSFVFAETFKYFYLIFSEDKDIIFDLDEFIFTTEAHLVPVNIVDYVSGPHKEKMRIKTGRGDSSGSKWKDRSCPSISNLFDMADLNAVKNFRDAVLTQKDRRTCNKKEESFSVNENEVNQKKMPLRAEEFVAGRADHMAILKNMGITIQTIQDGRVQLVHKTNLAQTLEDAEIGIRFMADMLELSKQHGFQLKSKGAPDEFGPMSVIFLPNLESGELPKQYHAGPAQFGLNLKHHPGLFGKLLLAEPLDACTQLSYNASTDLTNKIIVAKRGNCIFIDKTRNIQKAGALGLIIIDNTPESSYSSTVLFSMSGDGVQDVKIPSVFLFSKEGNELLWEMRGKPDMVVYMGDNLPRMDNFLTGSELALNINPGQLKRVLSKSRSSKRSENFFEKPATTCLLKDFKILSDFYNSFPKLKSSTAAGSEFFDTSSDDENENIKETVIMLDNIIHLVVSDDGDKYLEIGWEALINEVKQSKKADDDKASLSERIFNELIRRFEAKTNIMGLNNRQVYVKALRNWLSTKLEPEISDSVNLAEHDQTFLKLLAAEIDYGPDNNDLEFMSRTKKKTPANKGGG